MGSLWPGEGQDDPSGEDRDDVWSLCIEHPQDHGMCRPQIILLQGRLFLLQSLFSKDLATFNHEVLVHEASGIPWVVQLYVEKLSLCYRGATEFSSGFLQS